MGNPVTAIVLGAAISGVASASQERKAQKRAAREEKKLVNMENNRSIRQAQRESRRARAAIEASSAIQGQLTSSSTYGVLGSLQTQLQGNLEYMDNASELNTKIMNARQKQADWAFYGSVAKTVGTTAMMFGKPAEIDPTTKSTTVATPTTRAPAFTTTPARNLPTVNSTPYR